MSMKKSLTLLLVGAAMLFATPANAQKKAAGLQLPERQLTAEQQKAIIAEKKANHAEEAPFYLRKSRENTIKVLPWQKTDFSDRFQNVNAPKLPAKAPLTATSTIYNVPQEFKFTSNALFNLFSVIDANGDGTRFTRSGTYATISYAKPNDDWLVSPGLNLTANKYYIIRLVASARMATYPEEFDVKWGNAPTVEGLTNEAIPTTQLGATTATPYEVMIRPQETGVYYIGIHCTSYDAYNFYVHSLAIEDGPVTTTPAAVEDLTVTPEPTGALQATISGTAPTVDLDGDPLTSLIGAKIYRGSEEIMDLTYHIAAGEPFTFVDDEIAAVGMASYSVVFYNADGDGASASANSWIGLDAPTAVTNPVLTDDGTNIKLTWEASTALHGGVFFPEEVQYIIVEPTYNSTYGEWEPTQEGVIDDVVGKTEWSLKFDTNSGDSQGDLYLSVYTANDTDYAWDFNEAASNPLLIGAPYALPWNENFANNSFHSYFSTAGSEINNRYANITVSEGADEDGVSLEFLATYDLINLTSGKISLAGAANPALVYKLKNIDPEAFPGILQVSAITPDGESSLLESIDFTEGVETDWTIHTADLSALKNEKYIQIQFQYMVIDEAGDYHAVDIDDINVLDYYNTNVKVDVAANESAARNEDVTVNVKVSNNGATDVNAYRIKVSVADEVIADYTKVETIAPFTSKDLAFKYTISNTQQAAAIAVKAEVTVEGDGDTSDNVATTTIDVTAPEVNSVQNLKLEATESARTLTWEAPIVPEDGVVTVTDDFESYDAYAVKNIGNWTLYTGATGAVCGGLINGADYTNQETSFAYIVMNPTNFGGYNLHDYSIDIVDAHSGEQALASIYKYIGNNFVTNDDWLISPELSGNAQTIKFWHKGGTNYGNQTIEVLSSTTDNNIASFAIVGEQIEITENKTWAEATVELAEGTKYFAIRNVTDGEASMIVMIDDITYEAFQKGGEPVAKYAVYRNGKPLAETTALTFTDTDELADGEYTYQVTAIYADGTESAPLAVVYTVVTDGIATVISNGEKFDVYTVNGMKVREGVNTLKGLQKGIYVVNGKKVTIK